jgi:hypothetical protein
VVRFDHACPNSANRFLAGLTAQVVGAASRFGFCRCGSEKAKIPQNLDAKKLEKKMGKRPDDGIHQ